MQEQSILECMDNLVDNLIQEVRATKKKVVRRGKVTVKMSCPKGFKLNRQTNDCQRMSPAETRMKSKAALRGAKTRSKNTFGQQRALKKRAKSIRKGKSKGIYGN